MKVSGCLVLSLAFLAVAHARPKVFQDGKEYVYQSEIRVATGTMDYAPHLAGGIYRMKTRVQVSNSENTLNVEISGIKKSEYMGAVDPRNKNTNGMTFSPAQVTTSSFQVNLNADGSFKNFKSAATDPKVLNVMRGWASFFQLKAPTDLKWHTPVQKSKR